jgi:hypothetical protein
MASRFRSDLAQEHLLHPWLDRCYAGAGIRVERVASRELQLQGIDARLSKDGFSFLTDEKAQLHYIGKRLPTFALEIDLLKAGSRRPGWLFDAGKRTEAYAFIFDIRSRTGAALHHADDVEGAHVVLVNRQRLIAHLAEEGLDRAMLDRLSAELRAGGDDRRSVRAPGVRVVISRHLVEQPVNLLVRRRFLERIGQVLTPGSAWDAATGP